MDLVRCIRRGGVRTSGLGMVVALLAFFGAGCATTSQKLRVEARKSVLEGNYSGAEKLLRRDEVLADAKSRVLTLLELGTLANLSGEFEKSNRILFFARDMVEQLFTKSISEGASTWVLNDLSATYRGLDYERSLIHYYIVMNFLQIAQADALPPWELAELKIAGKQVFPQETRPGRALSDKERRQALMQARAEVLAWDTTLETIRNKSRGEPVYKDDLLAKLLGAQVHLMLGTREDLATAKVLYDDAMTVLQRAYNLYPTFNEKFRDFAKDYSLLPSLPEEAVVGRYVASTPATQGVQGLIRSAAESAIGSSAGESMFLLELGLIPEKREKVHTIGLGSLFGQIQDPRTRALVEEIGVRVLLNFAPKVGIGLVSLAVVGAATSGPKGPKHLSGAVDKAIGFEFKLPEIPRATLTYPIALRLVPTSEGKTIELPLAPVDPIGDFASQEVDTASAAIAARTGVRVGLKYLGALAAAYVTYRQLAKNELVAVLASTAAFVGAKAAIDASEAADTRAWSLLPHAVAAAQGSVPPGDYDVRVVGPGYSGASLGQIRIAPSRRNVFKWRVSNVPKAKPLPGPTNRQS